MRYNLADLHVHSFCSDGLRTPTQAVEEAHSAGLQALSLTDHDTVAGIDEAVDAGKKRDLEVVPGTELSAHLKEREVHILAYCFEWKHPRLADHLGFLHQHRFERGSSIVERLNSLGLKMTLEEVLGEAGASPLGRPHIAATMVNRGLVTSKEEAFDRYLGNRAPAFVPKPYTAVKGVIELIHQIGGVAVLAHPGANLSETLVAELVDCGLDGIEVFHPSHQRIQIDYYIQLATRYGLLKSGGSDSHGDVEGTRIGEYGIGYEAIEAMRDRAAIYS